MYCFLKFLSSWAPSLFYIWRTHDHPRRTLCRQKEYIAMDEIVGNKTKGRILKRLFQENKARQIFRKINISYPMIRTKTKHAEFSEILIFLTPWYAPRQIFRKINISYPLMCVSGGKNCLYFRKNWRALFSWNTRFEICPFDLLPTISSNTNILNAITDFFFWNQRVLQKTFMK